MSEKAVAVQPAYAVGDIVTYIDRQGRRLTGRVMMVVAQWHDREHPHVTYTLQHPTYRDRRFHTSILSIIDDVGRAAI